MQSYNVSENFFFCCYNHLAPPLERLWNVGVVKLDKIIAMSYWTGKDLNDRIMSLRHGCSLDTINI